MTISIYETSLRDGLQGEGMQLSLHDKLRVTEILDDLGVAYIEGGWPGSNPRDEQYFERAGRLKMNNARLVAFGATRRASLCCEDDENIKALIRAQTPVVAIFGKSWRMQAIKVLGISPEENLDLVTESVRYLKTRVDEVVFDAEHFFDGYADDPDYAMAVLTAAQEGGADHLVLCDTNGGTLTDDVHRIVSHVHEVVEKPLGIHTHNDAEMAVANSVSAVMAGVTMVQGTLNGWGERCGNANLVSIIAALELKRGFTCLPKGKLKRLTQVAHTLNELANIHSPSSQPYIGRSAFAHKGGMHADAVVKECCSYEHIEPESVGNHHRFLVSDLSGGASLRAKARELGIELAPNDPAIPLMLKRLKALESKGYQFEGADASFKLLIDRFTKKQPSYFELHDLDVKVDVKNHQPLESPNLDCSATARIKLEVGGVTAEAHATGDGPVHAIDRTLRKLIDKFYPSLAWVKLLDYKVRVLSDGAGTASVVRVLIRSGDENESWSTVGVSQNIIEASWLAMVDALEYQLIRDKVEPWV